LALPPTLHVGLVLEVIEAVSGDGAAKVTIAFAVHPFASVTVTVYEPEPRPLAVSPVPPEGAQLYVYEPVPPVAVTTAIPSVLELHNGLLLAVIVAFNTAGSVNVTFAVVVHPFASVTVTVYEPAAKPLAVAEVPPEGAHEYVYEPVPPLAVTVALPVLPPLHNGLELDVIEAVNNAGSVKVTVAVPVHKLASVIVTV